MSNLIDFPLLTVPRAPSPSLEAWRQRFADLSLALEAEAAGLLSVHYADTATLRQKAAYLDTLVCALRDHIERGAE